MPNWVGDVIMATPALRAIRTAAPDAEIVAAVKGYVGPILQGNPYVDDMIVVDDVKGLRRHWWLRRRFRARAFDACVLLTNSFGSALPVWLAGVPVRIGYSGEGRGWMLSHRRAPETEGGKRKPVPMPVYYQRLLDLVGICDAGPEYVVPPTDDERTEMTALLLELGRDTARPLIALNPGARFGASKLWAPERFGRLARRAEDAGAQVLLMVGPGEDDLAAAIRAEAGPGLLDTSRAVVPLGPLRALVEHVDLLVTTDSGPRHLAVAAGKPTVVVMGPTWPEWTNWNLEQTAVVRHDVPCGPCHQKTCPLDHACMDLITVDEVWDRIIGFLPQLESSTTG